jgi:ABC-type hemin transport system ATPase subunit
MNEGKIVAVDTPEKVLTQSILKQVFKLACHVDNNPYTNVPRITFAGIEQRDDVNDQA